MDVVHRSFKEFCFQVLDKASVWMIPGSLYGKHGEGYLRIALTHPKERLAEAMRRLQRFKKESEGQK